MLEKSRSPQLVLWLTTGGLLFAAGCGGGGAAPAPSNEAVPSTTTAPATTTTPAASPAATPVASVDPNHLETKWIGSVPYDVFYDKPWEVASDATVLQGAQLTSLTPDAPNPAAQVSGSNMPTPANGVPMPAAAGATVNWAELITAELLNTEVKVVRTRLTANLQSLRTFNTEAMAISNDGAYLAALAAVAERHSENVNWKANAKYVRELGYQIYSKAEGTGRAAFEATQLPFEQLCTVLDGGPPPDVEAADNAAFADVAYLNELMKWIEPNFSAIKANVNTADRMKEDPEVLERQLRMLLVVGKMMGDASYEHSADAQYQKFVSDFVEGNRAALDAAKSGDFAGFQAGLNKVQTSCAECHPPFRGSDSGI